MIKRIKLSVILLLSFGGLVFPKETLFLPTYTTDVYEHYYYTTEKIRKGELVELVNTIDFDDNINQIVVDIKKNDFNFPKYIISDALIPKDTDELIQEEYITKVKDEYVWIPSYYLEVIEKKDREIIRNYEKELVKRYGEPNEYDDGWYGYILKSLIISNSCIDFGHEHLYVENINLIKNGFTIETLNFSALKNETENKMQKLNFIFDGDFLDVYLEPSNSPMYSYFKIKKSDYEKLKTFVFLPREYFLPNFYLYDKTALQKYNDEHAVNLATFEKPKRAEKNVTNVSKNKTMLVSENLKLRSGEATTTQVLTVMQAGTKVKILELGKAENIDGINSNWVKVEVLSGAKDRDGNTISRGTVGWCYGGYLAETTEANKFESTDTKEISDIKIEEASKQEINIGIVCAIIGAVLLLLLVILIFAVRKKKDNP